MHDADESISTAFIVAAATIVPAAASDSATILANLAMPSISASTADRFARSSFAARSR